MNDYEAMEAINAVLDEWFTGSEDSNSAMKRVARISGMNKFEHDAAKEQK